MNCRAEEGYQPGRNVVHLFVSGAMVPEAVAAADQLRAQYIFANVFNVTSGDLLFHDYLEAQHAKIRGQPRQSWVEELVPLPERTAPIVTVHDAHPHTLSFLGGALSTRMTNLGVTEFGQSGSQADLYQRYGIAPEHIVAAATWLVGNT
jgi:pyruvate dehydrogenase E1 component